MQIQLIGLTEIPLVDEGDNLQELILKSAKLQGINLDDGDILVVAETLISKAEGNFIDLTSMIPSTKAIELAEKTGKDPKLVEAIIQESNEIIRVGPDFIVSETNHGFICANAGIDESNVDEGKATPMPINPDKSALQLRNKLENSTQKEIAVIISDTQGRPFREGAVGVAIGVSGINSLWNRQGEIDLYGRELQTTQIAVADELAASASLIMGQADEGIPVVIIKGYDSFNNLRNTIGGAKSLMRPKNLDAFR
ncbi:MAG: coenzyme F420-0:L-glutamate ligase [Methanobacteriales archaeon HGW-Methanobacteriales-1]|jgi:coenzyme F420-0:L-glutamate ligase/coenzyme F420-1:gamma-L-glutamate ligase|nr:MAG: coenzyme F420-0:L-glutamate ligase [Methanobacteriales archaeon HGW-Methanobacteriales-1]